MTSPGSRMPFGSRACSTERWRSSTAGLGSASRLPDRPAASAPGAARPGSSPLVLMIR